jgi:FkbM family methyltransferase
MKSEYAWSFDAINYINESISTIAEIGSRDGYDAISLFEEFTPKKVYVFEADPTLSKEVETNLNNLKIRDVFEVFNCALGSENKMVKFHAVDLEKYDNKGIGSFYKVNFANRPMEDPDKDKGIVQKLIEVEQKMYTSLKLETPDLIAMDVQGGELEVLKGFESTLSKVKFIVLESSISENYLGGSQFIEVHNFLRNNFKLIKNSRYSKNNYKIFRDHLRYKASFNKLYQPDFNLLYANKNL